MATFVLIHGAGDDSWYWHRVRPLLEAAGHTVVAPDLPCEDDAAGLAEYVDVVVSAVSAAGAPVARPLVVVAQSLGGLVAPLVPDRIPVDELVLLAAMVPAPGEPPGELWGNTGLADDRTALYEELGLADLPSGEMDLVRDFFHDADPDLRDEILARPEIDQSGTPFEQPWPRDSWPDVPTRFLAPRDDRMFPLAYQQRVVRDRLGDLGDGGVQVEELPGAHCVALTEPEALAAALLRHQV